MGLITAAKLLLKGKAGLGVIKKIEPTLGKLKTSEYLAKTAYKRGASKGYTEAMKSLHKKKETVRKTKHYYAPKDF